LIGGWVSHLCSFRPLPARAAKTAAHLHRVPDRGRISLPAQAVGILCAAASDAVAAVAG
jgi:hypothetical protein